MKKLYMDMTKPGNEVVGVFVQGAELVPAGTTIYSMPVTEKNEEYRRFAEEYDIHFIFDDNIPQVDFYAVPWIDIMAVDSRGGMIGTLGRCSDLESDAAICYIDKDRKCYRVAENGKEFLEHVRGWRERMERCEDVVIYACGEEAERELEFWGGNLNF